MEAHHASLGRRKLEEIRQKKTSKEQDLLLKQELEEVTRQRDELGDKLEKSAAQVENLLGDLKEAQDKEIKTVITLKQTIKTLSVERDAAVMAKEDLLSQLRISRRRLQEAEDEQYKAEEDAAVLRAELQHLRNEEAAAPRSNTSDHRDEHELETVRAELEKTLEKLQHEHDCLVNEQQKYQKLADEHKELEVALATSQRREMAANEKTRSKVDSGKYEQQLRELASMVERLESGRQKLLAEIDRQSLQIEKLFEENGALESALAEAKAMAVDFEHQLYSTSKERLEKAQNAQNEIKATSSSENPMEDDQVSILKMELAKTSGQRDELDARVLQLAVELKSAKHSLNILSQMLKPVLGNIHGRLLQVKQSHAGNLQVFA